MNNSNKEQIGCDVICKSHSARTERDLYRICPSKLSKRELEDLYFALLENNLELKKTINVQQDKMKVLSTRLQRMTVVHKNVAGKEKDCCASKAVVNEQRESITDLKKTNERMAERIRLLNMKLCSAKQFLKRSPLQSANCNKICTRCTFKNSSMSALNAKRSDSNMRTTTVSCQFLEKDIAEKPTRTTETATEIPEKEDSEKLCNENKCRTMMDEFKEKIVNLQEELAISHSGYSERIAALESQVCRLHEEKLQAGALHAASEHALRERGTKAQLLHDQLRTADAKCNELNMELSIERSKVTELETGLKLANMSKQLVETINQLAAEKEEKQEPRSELCRNGSGCSVTSQKQRVSSPKLCKLQQTQLEIPATFETKNDVKVSISEDSGYTELNKSCETDEDQTMVKMNQELLKKIADLQTQLDLLRISAAGEVRCNQIRKPKDFESYDVETKDVDENQTPNAVDPEFILLDQASEMECKRKRKPKEFESYDAETKDIDETQAENAVDQGFMLKRTSDNDPEADRCLNSPRGHEQMVSSSNPWEYLVSDRSDQHNEDTISDDKMNVECAIKQKSEARVLEDEHNRFQIPGPMPVANLARRYSEDSRNYKNTPNRKDSYSERPKNKKANSEEKTVKIFENSKESYFNSVKANESSGGKQKELSVNLKEHARGNEGVQKSKDLNEKKQKSGSITSVQVKLAHRTPTRDSIFANRKKMANQSDVASMAEVKKESTTSFYLESVCTPPTSVLRPEPAEANQATQVQPDDVTSVYPLCSSRAAICRCPVVTRRDVAVFRSCSGTLRFRTTAASDKLRQCACYVQDNEDSQTVPPPTPKQRDSATYTAEAPNTYTVEVGKRSRATSPDNTEHEISSMTDLPSEKDAKSPRAELSPGEEKVTMTYTDTETMLTDYGSLSEGEMPAGGRVRTTSIGEAPLYATRTSMPVPSSSERMEATLQSISEELARCRELLLSQRPPEKGGAQATVLGHALQGTATGSAGVGHALRPSVPYRSIAAARAPACVFTLHIGTMVLSDESVLFTRDKTLVLVWKFYSRAAVMTHVSAGRVVQIHFHTEYDIAFDDHFLNYMKNSDMAIVLCELGQQSEPFAMCSLPLREALLHANRRADMSLALIPTSVSSRDSVGDEIGVLDLWCTLRVDGSLLPGIRRAMHTDLGYKGQFGFESDWFNKSLAARHRLSKLRWSKNKPTRERVDSLQEFLKKRKVSSVVNSIPPASMEGYVKDEESDQSLSKINNIKNYTGLPGLNELVEATKKSVKYTDVPSSVEPEKETSAESDELDVQSIDITILWLALNEGCEAMVDPKVQRLYVAYSFLGRRGADLETPCSLPKPKHYSDKCYFNFKKTFHLHESDLPLLGHMSRCRAGGGASTDSRDCIVFTLVSEPPEDPLGLSSCEDIGNAYLYLGDVLAYSGGSTGYTEAVGVRGVRGGVCGVLAVRVDQLPVLRRCLSLSHSRRGLQVTSLLH